MTAGLVVVMACGPAPPPTQTVRGILVSVEAASIQRVETFTLRTDDGNELTFSAASNFNAGVEHAMSPGHMREHMALADPVTITYREENGRLVALSATD